MSKAHGEWLDRIRGRNRSKSAVEQTCETCKYNNRTWDMEPCDSCTIGGDGNKWERGEEHG